MKKISITLAIGLGVILGTVNYARADFTSAMENDQWIPGVNIFAATVYTIDTPLPIVGKVNSTKTTVKNQISTSTIDKALLKNIDEEYLYPVEVCYGDMIGGETQYDRLDVGGVMEMPTYSLCAQLETTYETMYKNEVSKLYSTTTNQ